MEGQGRAPLTLWAFVTRYDLTHADVNGECNDNKPLVSVPMWPEWTARDVQTELKKALKLGQSAVDSSLVLKVRNGEGMLLPMTPTALNSTSKQPLVIEVCAPHQHVTGTESGMDALPASFRKTVEGLINTYETRLAAVEAGLVGLESRRASVLEAEVRRIHDTLNFMSRRLELTQTPDWITGAQT
ncbi:uncharacterized protein LOC122251151 [Penaeus japonicus]|uniref:uncharacterized protein LOC122251151 n=1 Tax=Penaeus japonicus TaxID=27405 RepID=UPI001C71096B|nr:uncharacterized protein LOC122251151 [Penaeus japonicus]